MTTSTCLKCGKIDLRITFANETSYIMCTACNTKKFNPIPDDFTNQVPLTKFFTLTKKETNLVNNIQSKPKKLKQTTILIKSTDPKPH